MGIVAKQSTWNTIQFFTPDHIDAKIEKVEDWIEVYLIKWPYVIVKKSRGFVKKK